MVGRGASGRELFAIAIGVQLQSGRQLLEIAGTVGASGGLARGLNGRQQHGDQDADDGDHDQEFHQRETPTSIPLHIVPFRYKGR